MLLGVVTEQHFISNPAAYHLVVQIKKNSKNILPAHNYFKKKLR
jgi:hypothetical protein